MKKTKINNRYLHNEEDILKACRLEARDALLSETYNFVVDLWNVTLKGPAKVELIEGLLNDPELTNREKAFLFYQVIACVADQHLTPEMSDADYCPQSKRLVGNA